MRIAFFATPDFALPSLYALAQSEHEVVGVFTQPDRPQGRGMRVVRGAVSAAADELGLEKFQFERVSRQAGLDALRALKPDLMVSAAFGQIFSAKILAVPPMGCINVHASLLPKYRGSSPINWAIIRGETQTGITTMLTDIGVDTGDILLQNTLQIAEDETAGELIERMAHLGAQTLMQTLEVMQRGELEPIAQDHTQTTHCEMLSKQSGFIDWQADAQQIKNRVRGVTPWPAAWCDTRWGVMKIWAVQCVQGMGVPGEVLQASDDGWVIAAREGALKLCEVQLSGKKRMQGTDFLRGHPIEKGSIL